MSTSISVDTYVNTLLHFSSNSFKLSNILRSACAFLAAGRFGIMEPVNRTAPAIPDEDSLCIVPALTCDKSGLRLGYGRGYYDRFLAGFPGKSVIICYSDFVGEVPAEPHDRRADAVITD